jgi:plastocyanin
MRQRQGQGRRRGGTYVAAGMLVACGALAAVGAAGATQQAAEETISATSANQFVPPSVDIETGDTVVWNFTGGTHNVNGTSGPAEDPEWPQVDSGFKSSGEYRYTFTKPGTYAFVCDAHPGMAGTVTATGAAVTPTPTPSATASPTPTASPSATPTPTPTPTPAPDDHTSTPPPTASASADTAAPALSGVKVKSLRRGARVTFKLSEPAAVTLRVTKRSGKVVRTVSVQGRPGTRTVTVRSSRLKRGRYTVELQARDASGNRSTLLRAAFRIRR